MIKTRSVFDLKGLEIKLAQLEQKMQTPEVWSNQNLATEIGQEIKDIKETLEKFTNWDSVIQDALTAEEIDDEELLKESELALQELTIQLDKYDIQKMLSGEYDDADAFLTINSGAGGTDAQDWANMLLRMYTRWAEQHNFKVHITDILPGEEAGVKNVTLFIEGSYAYGFLKSENGVHYPVLKSFTS